MREKIGNVILDDTFYPGKDLYSDGEIEDELLDIVKTYGEEQLNQVIAERGQWAVLYHLSHIRGNIVQWIPMDKSANVLEVGSGCGAITGTLARKAGSVTCIELSKKRSLINAHRNKRLKNIQIMMGNFSDIEKNLDDKYDFITLIGVFEYAQGYIQGQDPYESFLNNIASQLAPDGRIIIAIENRLGLKYFAGCREDHTGEYFDGLEGYDRSCGVRTFSKKELEDIFCKCDLECEFYYPYPDYKLPTVIFSDQRLPKAGELCLNERNFDRERIKAFNEEKVYETLVKDGLFPLFSNSYLVMLTKKEI